MSKLCLFLLVYICAVLSVSSLASETNDIMHVRHYNKGYTPSIRDYQRDLLRVLLENTIGTFGPYKLELFTTPLSTNRSKLTLQKGEDVNILFASEWKGFGVSDEQVLALELPIYYGLHGLRQLIIRSEEAPLFANIKTLQAFKELSCGQGAKWLDVNIYLANGIAVNEGQSFENLMPMLQKKRFNYLPLSVLEADLVFAERSPELKNLVVLDNLMIFYPLPSFLFFPASEHRLLERLKSGFVDLEKRGHLSPLFEQHFSTIPRILSGQRKRLVLLDNPGLTAEKNRSMKDEFLRKFGIYFEILE
jgi:hypothetical protein